MTANPVRPARYRPGKPVGPEVHESSDEEEDDEEEEAEDDVADEKPSKPIREPAAIVSSALKKVDLNKRFEQARKEEEARKAAEESSEEDSGAEADEGQEKDADEEGSSEYTSESEEEESEPEENIPKPILLRPKFIPKSKRNGTAVAPVTAAPAAAAQGEGNADNKAQEAERRREEAQALVEEHLRQQAEAREASRRAAEDDHANDASLIDDTDDIDPAAERAAWKLRELLRVKRERDELEKVEKEREEIERRRNMDEKDRYKEDMEYVRKQREEAKDARGEMKFMQKYYHKGAFYQDDSEILKRNYATAQVEDQAVNKEILPKYMQVRGEEYGKRGKTKWTHLAAEDTSKLEGGSPWFDKKFAGKPMGKLGGMKDERFLPDKVKGERKEIDDRTPGKDGWGNGRQPPDGPKAMSGHERSRTEGRHESDRPRPRPSRSRSRSRDRDRDRERAGDRYHPRGGDRYRDPRREGGRDQGRYHDRDRDVDSRRERNRDGEGDRKRRPPERDGSADKRRRVENP